MAMQSVTLTQLTSLLPVYWKLKLPVFFWGTAGSAKSSTVHRFVEQQDIGFIDLRLSQLDPVDVRGIPDIDGESATWRPFDCFPDEERDGKYGVLLLDEFNSGPPTVQCSCYQLLFDRRIGNYKLPDGWVVWACGNRSEDNGVTFDVPAPNANRFANHVHVDPTVDDFDRTGIRQEVIAFLFFRPELLFSYSGDATDMAFGSMRTWTYLSKLYDAWEAEMGEVDRSKPSDLFRKTMQNAVGEGEGHEFVAFLNNYGKMPNLNDIISNPEEAPVPSEMSVMWAVVSGLIGHYDADHEIGGRILRYALRLSAEFGAVLVRQCHKIDEKAFEKNPDLNREKITENIHMLDFSKKFGNVL